MKENILDVLMYLLQNAPMDDMPHLDNHSALQDMLMDAGFEQGEIHAAFRWLDDLDHQISRQPRIEHRYPAVRCFSLLEEQILDTTGRNYLLSLLNSGILSPNSFELVMDRVTSLAEPELTIDQLEWIVLLVLSNQSDEQASLDRLESMLVSEQPTPLN